jgi:hypothetical protein
LSRGSSVTQSAIDACYSQQLGLNSNTLPYSSQSTTARDLENDVDVVSENCGDLVLTEEQEEQEQGTVGCLDHHYNCDSEAEMRRNRKARRYLSSYFDGLPTMGCTIREVKKRNGNFY